MMTVKQRFHLRSSPPGRLAPVTTPERGELANRAGHKLCAEQVLEMRRGFRLGYSARELAKRFGISDHTAGRIRDRKIWSHIPEPETQLTENE